MRSGFCRPITAPRRINTWRYIAPSAECHGPSLIHLLPFVVAFGRIDSRDRRSKYVGSPGLGNEKLVVCFTRYIPTFPVVIRLRFPQKPSQNPSRNQQKTPFPPPSHHRRETPLPLLGRPPSTSNPTPQSHLGSKNMDNRSGFKKCGRGGGGDKWMLKDVVKNKLEVGEQGHSTDKE